MNAGLLNIINLNSVNLFELLDTGLNLHSLSAFVPESLNEVLCTFYFFLLISIRSQLLFPPLLSQNLKFGEGYLVIMHLSSYQLDGSVGYIVQKKSVVRNQNY